MVFCIQHLHCCNSVRRKMHSRSHARRRPMLLPRLVSSRGRLPLYLSGCVFLVTVSVSLWAQDAPAPAVAQTAGPAAPESAPPQPIHLEASSVPRSAFPHVLQPYRPQALAPPNLANSPRLDGLMK